MSHLLLVEREPDVPRRDGRLREWYEQQTMASRDTDFHGAEGRLIGRGVDVDRLKRADLVAVDVDHVMAPPRADILNLEHVTSPRLRTLTTYPLCEDWC